DAVQTNRDLTQQNTTKTEDAPNKTDQAPDTDQAQERNDQRDVVVNPKEDKAPIQETATTPNKVVSSTPESGVTYKVQILAAHRVVDKSYLKSKYGFRNKYNIENHEGWVKYTTGLFGEYEQARNERERLKEACSNLPGPFVTAYSDGERITVQEALLLSKQKWVQ
ncbi:MAG: hypothetical protein ACKO66_07475, partial [Flavobacteriales bacterium]